MAVDATESPPLAQVHWQRDIVAGPIVGILALPIYLAAGVLTSPASPKLIVRPAPSTDCAPRSRAPYGRRSAAAAR